MTSTRPDPSGSGDTGDVQVISVSDTTVNATDAIALKLVGLYPKYTPTAPVNPVPKMVTAVPPACTPKSGLTSFTTGRAITESPPAADDGSEFQTYDPTQDPAECVTAHLAVSLPVSEDR